MNANEFAINFGNLAPGEYEFEYEIDDTFFQRFENSVIQKGNVDVLVVLEKKENMLMLDFTMEGDVVVACDRCLEDLTLEIQGYNELIVKIGEATEEISDDVLMISSKEHEIDVAQYIYEYISLIIPMRNVHGEEGEPGCDPEVLKEMEKHINHEQQQNDPRWDALKNINLN
jgi:uncharacterized metal-binding protein YceD (DUF177 family)